MAKNPVTSKRVARKAGEILRGRYSAKVKSVAGAALAGRRGGKRRR